MSSSRLPSGKLGGSWGGFANVAMNGSTPAQQQQQRVGSLSQHNLGGGSQQLSSTPLDLSEFPSLSGTPGQATHPPTTPGQNIWARAVQQPSLHHQQQQPQQHTPQPPHDNVIRQPSLAAPGAPAQASSSARQHQQHPQPQHQQHQHMAHEDMFPSANRFATQLDDYRNNAQVMNGQLAAAAAAAAGNDGGVNFDRGQHGGPGAPIGSDDALHANGQNGTSGQGVSTSRSPMTQPGPNGVQTQSKENASKQQLNNQPPNDLSSQQLQQQQQQQQQQVPSQQQQQSRQPPSQQQQQQQQAQGAAQTAAANEKPQPDTTSIPRATTGPMADRDRFGLHGLLGMIHNENLEVAALAIGQDLMALGLDLSSELPLHPSFASPFAPTSATVPLVPDFTLPACYSVANVQPLQNRMSGFSDETLFYIFYSMPRDIMQEFAAEELMARKWRYHKVERLWLTRDDTFPNPVEIERGVSERGVYCWWDAGSWKKIRREFILRYADLDNHLEPGRGMLQYGQAR